MAIDLKKSRWPECIKRTEKGYLFIYSDGEEFFTFEQCEKQENDFWERDRIAKEKFKNS